MYVFQISEKIKITFSNTYKIVKLIDEFLALSKNFPCHVITLNSLIYLQSKFDYKVKRALENSALIICDSYWLSLLCSIFSLRLLNYLAGVELFEKICALAGQKKYTVYLFGGKEEVVRATAEVLKQKFKINIVGYHHGYIFSSAHLQQQIIKEINKVSADILFVGLPTELQERWIYENINKLNCRVVIGVGGSFDVISGRLRRAPKFLRVLGLEWFFRMLQEPWRVVRILKLPLAIIMFCIDCLSWRLLKLINKKVAF